MPSLLRARRHVVLAIAATWASGCTPQLQVHVLQPAPVNLGTVRRLTVVQTEGRRAARDFLLRELVHRARQDGYFRVADRSNEGIVVKVAGDTVQVLAGGRGPLTDPDGIALRIDVHDWDADRKTERGQSPGGAPGRPVSFYEGTAVVSVTVFSPSGQALLAEREYVASGRGLERGEAIDNAGREVVRRLLGQLTPQSVTRSLRLDDEDRQQQPILARASEGDVPRALSEMRAYVRAHPRNATALYNLGVLLDAAGHYPEALEHYTQAISLSAKGYYLGMKEDCAGRLADQRALSE